MILKMKKIVLKKQRKKNRARVYAHAIAILLAEKNVRFGIRLKLNHKKLRTTSYS